MNEKLKKIIDTFWDILYPKDIYCICCGNLIDQTRTYGLCDHCITHIKWNLDPSKRIPIRNIPLGNIPTTHASNHNAPNGYITTPHAAVPDAPILNNRIANDFVVPTLCEQPTKFLELLRCTEYGIYERSIIFALKYNGHKYISRNIGEIMKDRLLADPELGKILALTKSDPPPTNDTHSEQSQNIHPANSPDWHPPPQNNQHSTNVPNRLQAPFPQAYKKQDYIIVPVPLHEDKYYKRGFNQAELMGKYLGKEIDLPMINALRRDRDTKPMRGLGPEERKANVEGSMSLASNAGDRIAGKSIILVDDFYTTGSTALECAKVLYAAGAKRVIMLAFAAR